MTPAELELGKLKASIREANDHLLGGEGVDLLYYWPECVSPDLREVMAEVIGEPPRQEARPDGWMFNTRLVP